MNALALWVPGTLLFIAGVLLFALGRVELAPAIAIGATGLAVETVGVLLWLKQRKAAGRK